MRYGHDHLRCTNKSILKINFYFQRQQTPLVVAAELGHTEVADVLIKHKADLFATEKV